MGSCCADLCRLLGVACWLAAVPAAGHEAPSVRVDRDDGALRVEARAELEADVAVAWQVLTDYERLPDFVPGMRSSRVLWRSGDHAVVEQRGEARLLFLVFPIEMRLDVTEYPRERIVSRAVAGNVSEMRGAYVLERAGERLSLRYSGRIVPGFDVPDFIETLVLREHVEKTFGAMVAQIERRQAQVRREAP